MSMTKQELSFESSDFEMYYASNNSSYTTLGAFKTFSNLAFTKLIKSWSINQYL